ncbi:hypothetical protein T265_01997 [Opisthorchis viverrini]|uniref:Uncharacterized protein n=1 Tax=Opisthorchis viverrini TaxID=6198 RepID=A0A075AIM9_OPIVI|nr:hypothetical protein T265_01997 [Opisthorchis viverrini]KER31914.1 hypothetical protein T265_01997 [Opisthorchis viverrini]
MQITYTNQQDPSASSPNSLKQSEVDPLLQVSQNQKQLYSKQSGDTNTRPSPAQGEAVSSRVVPGAAFNTTPIYDAQGSLVGLQTPCEAISPTEDSMADHGGQIGYAPLPPMFPYSMTSPSIGCSAFPNSSLNQAFPSHSQQQQQQYVHYQSQPQNHEFHPKPVLLTSENAMISEQGHKTVIRGLPKPTQSFDSCPAVCSLFAIFCCPITLWCSLPALVYSLCSYTDYRAADMDRYQRKSDVARHLVITACIIGLLLCITWAILAFFYYELIITTIGDIIRVIQHRFYTTR